MSNSYYLYEGRGKRQHFELPGGWKVTHFLEADEGPGVSSAREMAATALRRPTGLSLAELIAGGKKIAVVVDDWTRPTPVAEVLEALLPHLAELGVALEDTTIVVALGTHDPMSAEELEARVGTQVATRYRVVQHNAWASDLVPVRIPGDERVLRVNPDVAAAEVKIGVSSILPHPMAGYSGGPKIVMPGVSNFEFVRDHHMRHTIHPASKAGITKGNPFHDDVFRAARAIGLNFSINCVYDQQGQLHRILAGDLETAFAAAVETCFDRLGARFDEKVDITITSAYPHTHGHQMFKALSAPDEVTKETGAILLFAPMAVPISDDFLGAFDLLRERSHQDPAAYVTEAMSQGRPFLPDKPLEFNTAMSCAILRPPIRTVLVSPVIPETAARTMGMEYANSVEAAVALLEAAYPEARVAIFPSGGLIVPITSWGD